ncbi:hypothetical protein SAMN05192546_1044 [Tindallia californiensis]|uniref:Flp pilus assembly protein, pilin Flp n=2 Tax=Tindallia californiensis TaxID=159292 RepID=A0A1H3M5H6_9FIRM|nr:hypothetical protein SAMN05192546_1044 [Tindallia californiensis]
MGLRVKKAKVTEVWVLLNVICKKGGLGMERKMVWFFICSDETGQGLVEYALIMILVSVIAVTILGEIGDIVKDFFGIADYLGP